LEDQYLERHRELKDGGTLRDLVSGELTIQAHALDRCVVEEPSLDGAYPLLHPLSTESLRDGKVHLFDDDVVEPRSWKKLLLH
jgi:hypothetical protein